MKELALFPLPSGRKGMSLPLRFFRAIDLASCVELVILLVALSKPGLVISGADVYVI